MNMNTKTMRASKILFAVLIGGAVGGAKAQDAHFSQYDAAPVLLNPALTGMYEHSDFRMNCNMRSQWSRLNSNFLTTAFSYDAAIQNQYGAGFYLSNYDMAGMMKTLEAGLSGAYNVSGKNAKHTLSVGLKAGIIYKKVNDADLLYDLQYNDGYFDSDLPSGEAVVKKTRLLPELALGIAYRSIKADRLLNPFGSFAVHHITTPDETIFRVAKHDLPIRWTVSGGVSVRVMDEFHLIPMGLFQLQNKDREITAGMMGDYTLGGSAYSVVFGASYRYEDAVIGHAGLKHRNNVYRVSYDVTTSKLGEYNNKMGAFEFSIVYYGTHSGRERRVRSAKM